MAVCFILKQVSNSTYSQDRHMLILKYDHSHIVLQLEERTNNLLSLILEKCWRNTIIQIDFYIRIDQERFKFHHHHHS